MSTILAEGRISLHYYHNLNYFDPTQSFHKK